MRFLKKLLLLIAAVIVLGLAAVLYLLSLFPVYEPCERFESYFGVDTISFPIEGREAKIKFGGMKYDSLPPYFLYALRGDTLIRMHFRAGYGEDRFTKSGKDIATKWNDHGYTTDYDAKGIYGYSYRFSNSSFEETLEKLSQTYGKGFDKKESKDHKKKFYYWNIGPCHHLLLFQKKPISGDTVLKSQKNYTQIMFVYNLSEKEISDMVEADGAIRTESIDF